MKERLRLIRPAHCLKNLLVLLPLVFSGKLTQAPSAIQALCAFVCFCLLSSAVYVFNDLCDLTRDRLHPRKCTRPLAAGTVRIPEAVGIAVLLLSALTALSIWQALPTRAWLCLGAYLLLNLSYSLELKNIPILDVLLLAAGFELRVLFGAAVIGVPVSSWLYLTVAFFSLYMGFGKRRGDARSASATTVYTPVFLERAMQLCLTLALVFYSLWSAGAGLAGSRMLWTVPLAVCICLKYAGDLDAGAEGDPVELLLHDRVLLLLSLAFTVLVLLLLYL